MLIFIPHNFNKTANWLTLLSSHQCTAIKRHISISEHANDDKKKHLKSNWSSFDLIQTTVICDNSVTHSCTQGLSHEHLNIAHISMQSYTFFDKSNNQIRISLLQISSTSAFSNLFTKLHFVCKFSLTWCILLFVSGLSLSSFSSSVVSSAYKLCCPPETYILWFHPKRRTNLSVIIMVVVGWVARLLRREYKDGS